MVTDSGDIPTNLQITLKGTLQHFIRDYTERSLNDREWGEQFVTQRVRGELVMAWSLVTPDITTITGDIVIITQIKLI